MKFISLISVAILFSFSAMGSCPSVDDTIKKVKRGMATPADVEQAILCQYPTCDIKILVLTNKVTMTVEQFKVGEVTLKEVSDSARDLAEAKLSCTK